MNISQLRTHIEKTFHRLLADEIKEHIVDFTILYIRKNKLAVDSESLSKILEVVRLAVDDGYFKYVDMALDKLQPQLEEFVADANPLQHINNSDSAKKNG